MNRGTFAVARMDVLHLWPHIIGMRLQRLAVAEFLRSRFTLLAPVLTLSLSPMPGCNKWQVPGEQLAAGVVTSPVPIVAESPTTAASSKDPQGMSRRSSFRKPSNEELKQRLDPLAFEVTQRDATEPPFRNRYWNNHEPGIYVDVVSGEPLFSSKDKFDSGTGWPSFATPILNDVVSSRTDTTLGVSRTEVRSKLADSHLGHVFDDGPAPGGLRYCINSAALRFVPKSRLVEEGYPEYVELFAVGEGSSGTVALGEVAPNSCNSHPSNGVPGCKATIEEAYLAGGCFWGMQDILRKVPGVLQTEVGYMGGTTPNPTYEAVHDGTSGHAESVRVTFDPSRIAYATLLTDWFFRMHDPTTPNRQGNDIGTQYRSAIFVTSPEQRRVANEALAQVQKSGRWGRPIVTQVVDAGPFAPAEDYHQDYLAKHPGGYTCHYLR